MQVIQISLKKLGVADDTIVESYVPLTVGVVCFAFLGASFALVESDCLGVVDSCFVKIIDYLTCLLGVCSQ